MIDLPEGWTSWKSMPILEPEVLVEYDILDQDMFQLRSPGERFILDVGWYGSDLSGTYKCYLVEIRPDLSEDEYHPWDSALETFTTRKTSEVWQWLSKTISRVHHDHFIDR